MTRAEFFKNKTSNRLNEAATVATKQQDINEHWDYSWPSCGSTDFKEPKKSSPAGRSGPIVYDRHLIEWTNVIGNIGWVRGQAQWITFELQNTYLWVDRTDLESLVSSVNWAMTGTWPYSQDYVSYGRAPYGRKDQFCFVPETDIRQKCRCQEFPK